MKCISEDPIFCYQLFIRDMTFDSLSFLHVFHNTKPYRKIISVMMLLGGKTNETLPLYPLNHSTVYVIRSIKKSFLLLDMNVILCL